MCGGVSYIVRGCVDVSRWDTILRMRLFTGAGGEREISYLEERVLSHRIHSLS